MRSYAKSPKLPQIRTVMKLWICAGIGMTTGSVCSCMGSSTGYFVGIEEEAIRLNKPLRYSSDSSEGSRVSKKTAIESDHGATGVAADKSDNKRSPKSIEWLPSRGYECYRSKQYKGFCQGPRRVPKPNGPDAALAERLGLGEIKTAWQLLLKAPDPRWVEAARHAQGVTRDLRWPLPKAKVIRGFGKVGRSKRAHFHKGVDISAEEKALFYAVSDGIVAYADNEVRGYGNLLMVIHPDRSVAFYSHARALYVFAGQRVERGQVLGEVGHTGYARCAHLHFEYRIDGRPTNPLKKLTQRASANARSASRTL